MNEFYFIYVEIDFSCGAWLNQRPDMNGIEINGKINRIWIVLALSTLFGAFIFGVFKGPSWILAFSAVGLLSSAINSICKFKFPDRYPGHGASTAFGTT